MSTDSTREPCPQCGESIPVRALRCRYCGHQLREPDDDDVRPRRSREPAGIEPTDFLIPTNVSGWSIAACYFGFIGLCLPLVGLVFAIPAFICGIVALRKRQKRSSYGSVTSDIRAILGLGFSGVAILLYGGLVIFMLIAAAAKR